MLMVPAAALTRTTISVPPCLTAVTGLSLCVRPREYRVAGVRGPPDRSFPRTSTVTTGAWQYKGSVHDCVGHSAADRRLCREGRDPVDDRSRPAGRWPRPGCARLDGPLRGGTTPLLLTARGI